MPRRNWQRQQRTNSRLLVSHGRTCQTLNIVEKLCCPKFVSKRLDEVLNKEVIRLIMTVSEYFCNKYPRIMDVKRVCGCCYL